MIENEYTMVMFGKEGAFSLEYGISISSKNTWGDFKEFDSKDKRVDTTLFKLFGEKCAKHVENIKFPETPFVRVPEEPPLINKEFVFIAGSLDTILVLVSPHSILGFELTVLKLPSILGNTPFVVKEEKFNEIQEDIPYYSIIDGEDLTFAYRTDMGKAPRCDQYSKMRLSVGYSLGGSDGYGFDFDVGRHCFEDKHTQIISFRFKDERDNFWTIKLSPKRLTPNYFGNALTDFDGLNNFVNNVKGSSVIN